VLGLEDIELITSPFRKLTQGLNETIVILGDQMSTGCLATDIGYNTSLLLERRQ
jgi:hypothetical protein